MSLNAKQVDFAYHIAQLIVWANENRLPVIGAEWYRTKEQAEIYARTGRGIKNSNHRRKLAVDLFRYVPGQGVTWDLAAYAPLGEKWKTMHELARWGGDFRNRDAVHFSFLHNGVT